MYPWNLFASELFRNLQLLASDWKRLTEKVHDYWDRFTMTVNPIFIFIFYKMLHNLHF